MGRIAVLPENIANKIAAGEVILRPDSVVKELLENALDAGATEITIAVRDGGTSFIQVSDNGCGMDEDDAIVSFLRHATSKISTYEDLEEIRTFGFRGEALASIAAVARTTLATRATTMDAAVVVRVDGGGQPSVSRDARETGTTVTVQNLFFNVPARRKFLKSNATEFRHVYDVVVRTALSKPDCAFTFVSDGDSIVRLLPAPIGERLQDLFGERQFQSLLPVEDRTSPVHVSGFIGKPSFGQKSRAHQYLFLNGRFIVSRNISHAVHQAYEHLLVKGTFPLFVLFLDVDPRRVDVNVHPSKLEAKFEDEYAVYRLINAVVRRALSSLEYVPGLTLTGDSDQPGVTGLAFTMRQHDPDRRPGAGAVVDVKTGEITDMPGVQGREITERILGGFSGRDAPGVEGPVWQLHARYLLTPTEHGVLIMDQHVVHERVLYERAMRRMTGGSRASQQLLFPVTLELTPGDRSLVSELLPYLEQVGFDIKLFGGTTVVVDGIPPETKGHAEEIVLQEVLALYRDYRRDTPLDVRDTLAKSLACRAAVKSGDVLSDQEMHHLVAELGTCTMPYVCPHGRPVVLRISLDELDRRFGRG